MSKRYPCRPLPRRLTCALLVVALVRCFAAAEASASQPMAATVVVYAPPVSAIVVDPFRPPEHVGAPGNRGLEYGTAEGQEVLAAAGGAVTFAGPVADALFVTIQHADGVRTTYGHLDTIVVGAGATIAPAQPIGAAGPGFHFSARSGDIYLDPAVLLDAGGELQPPRLVPSLGGE